MEGTLGTQAGKTQNPSPWLALVKYGALVALALAVFFGVFLYFRELVLLVSYRSLVLIGLFFAFAVAASALFLFMRRAVQGFRGLEGAPRILFALILLALLVLGVIVTSVGTRVLPQRYADRAEAFTLSGVPAYLTISPKTIASADVRQHLHALVNTERARQGLPVLAYDAALETIAQRHSDEMATGHYLEHVNQGGEDAIARGNKAGYSCKKDYGVKGNTRIQSAGIGENLALTPLGNVVGCGGVYTAEGVARCTFQGWLNSTEHRKNILTPTYAQEGIGIARADKEFYITQNFC